MATAPATPIGTPATVVPVTPTTAAAGAPPPPPPAAPSTTHAGWGAVPNLPGRSVTGWYTNAYLAILVYLALPILGAVLCNLAGWQNGVWGILLLSTLFDLWVIFHPWAPAGISLAAYLRGQPGGEEGLNIEDGLKKAAGWLKNVYSWLAVVILGKQMALVALAFLPVRGFGGIALAILAVLLLVMIGNLMIFTERPWVIRFFWRFYTWILWALLGYWILAGVFFPQLRQAAAYSVVTSTQQKIRDQNDSFLKGEADKIQTKLEEMDASLSEEERVAKLSDKEKAIWAKAQSSSFTGKTWTEGSGALQRSYDAVAPTVKDAVDKVKGAASKPAPAVATTPTETAVTQTAWSCDTTVKVVDYTPSNQPGEVDIGSLPAGRYEVTATGKRRQMFFAGTAMDPVPTQLCEMDSYGRIGFCWNPDGQKVVRNMNGQPWFAPPNVPGSEPLLITEEPGEARVPYGALVIQAMGARLPIAPANQRTRLKFDQPFAVALNVNRYQGVRNHEGDGTLRVEIRQCHTT